MGTDEPSMTLSTTVRQATPAERAATGKAARQRQRRSALAVWQAPADRADPVALLAAQEDVRVPELLPLRHTRMSASAFAFYRGGATVMAHDLGSVSNTGLVTQLCGDAHLSNFGVFGAPDRSLVFDINDFDETHPGPFEWDVLRLAASFVLAGRDNGTAAADTAAAAQMAGRAYREEIRRHAGMADLDTWYARISVDDVRGWMRQAGIRGTRAVDKVEAKARRRTGWSAIEKLTAADADGRRHFLDLPPLLVPVPVADDVRAALGAMFEEYRHTVPHDRQQLLLRYRGIDMAHKVVGVGSVGLLAFVMLLQGRDESDLIVLQGKQAVASALEPFTAASTYPTAGERVVAGQQVMQAASDIFLGWVRAPDGRDFYVRQLRDMKYAPDPALLRGMALVAYAALCGRTLARAHARGGDAVALAAYLGNGDRFDRAVRDFSMTYADQVEQDFAAYLAAIAAGRVDVGDQAEESEYRLGVDPTTGLQVTARPA